MQLENGITEVGILVIWFQSSHIRSIILPLRETCGEPEQSVVLESVSHIHPRGAGGKIRG